LGKLLVDSSSGTAFSFAEEIPFASSMDDGLFDADPILAFWVIHTRDAMRIRVMTIPAIREIIRSFF